MGVWIYVRTSIYVEITYLIVRRYGVFQEHFIHQRTFGDASEAAIGAVGTVALGIEYFETLLIILVSQQWPDKVCLSGFLCKTVHMTLPQTRLMMWSCLGLCCGSLLLASFATKVTTLPRNSTKVYFWPNTYLDLAFDSTTGNLFWNRRWRSVRACFHLCEFSYFSHRYLLNVASLSFPSVNDDH